MEFINIMKTRIQNTNIEFTHLSAFVIQLLKRFPKSSNLCGRLLDSGQRILTDSFLICGITRLDDSGKLC